MAKSNQDDFESILNAVKNKEFKPVYLFCGDEAFFIDTLTDAIIANALTEDEKAFNQNILYGKDITANLIDNAARRYPMMAKRQVIIVREAQDMKGIEDLQYYVSKPLVSTVLVLNYKHGTLDGRSKLSKEIKSKGVYFESKKLYDNQMPTWINNYLKNKNYTIDSVACTMLTEFLGNDLSKVANELDKLIISLPAGTKITPENVEKNIGISKDFNQFELCNALSQKDVLKANRIINYFAQNPKDNPLVRLIVTLYNYFGKIMTIHFATDKSQGHLASVLGISPFFVKEYQTAASNYPIHRVIEIIAILRRYDLKSKGVDSGSTNHGDLLRELIFQIMHNLPQDRHL